MSRQQRKPTLTQRFQSRTTEIFFHFISHPPQQHTHTHTHTHSASNLSLQPCLLTLAQSIYSFTTSAAFNSAGLPTACPCISVCVHVCVSVCVCVCLCVFMFCLLQYKRNSGRKKLEGLSKTARETKEVGGDEW